MLTDPRIANGLAKLQYAVKFKPALELDDRGAKLELYLVSSEQLDSGVYVGVAAEYVAIKDDVGDVEIGAGSNEGMLPPACSPV